MEVDEADSDASDDEGDLEQKKETVLGIKP